MFMDRCIREVMSSVCLAVCLSVCLSIYSMVPVDDGGHIMMLVWAHEYTGIGSYFAWVVGQLYYIIIMMMLTKVGFPLPFVPESRLALSSLMVMLAIMPAQLNNETTGLSGQLYDTFH